MLAVQGGRGAPGGRADDPHRPGPVRRPAGQLVQQALGGRSLAWIALPGVHRDRLPRRRQVDRVEPGQLDAQVAVGDRVARFPQPVQVRQQIGGRVAQEDHRFAQRAGQVDQIGEPPPPVRGGRVTRVRPGPAGQQRRGLDEHQVRARPLQYERRVVRQQLLRGRVRGQRRAARVGQHTGHYQAVGCVLALAAGAGRSGPGQARDRVGGQEPVTRRPGPRVEQDAGPALLVGGPEPVGGDPRGLPGPPLPPHPVQVPGQPRAADPRPFGRRDDGLAELHRGRALDRHELRLGRGELPVRVTQRAGQPVPLRGQGDGRRGGAGIRGRGSGCLVGIRLGCLVGIRLGGSVDGQRQVGALKVVRHGRFGALLTRRGLASP